MMAEASLSASVKLTLNNWHMNAQGRTDLDSHELRQLEVPSTVEIILGPKLQTPEVIAKSMLRQAGFGDVNIRRSEASYR